MGIDMDVVRAAAEAELRGRATEAQLELLRAHLEEWFLVLGDLRRDVEQQVRERRAALEQRCVALRQELPAEDAQLAAMAEQAVLETWRAGAMNFKRMVEERLGQVKLQRNRARDERFAAQLSEGFYALVQGVEAHELELRARDAEPDEADTRLWALARATAQDLGLATAVS